MSDKTDSKPDQAPSPIGEISQEPSAFEAFLDAHQKKLIVIGILAILCVIGYVIFDGLKNMAARNAAGDVAAARTVPDYDAVSKEHAGKNAGGSALILKARLLWGDRQEIEAIKTLESFISDYPEHPALGNALATLGSFHEKRGDLDAAKEAFEKAAESESSASSLALLSLGDIAKNAGDNDKAREIYEEIISKYETSHVSVRNMARSRMELIGVKSPTEKIPEPPKPTPTPGAESTTTTTIPGLPGALKPTPGAPNTPNPGSSPEPAPKPRPIPTPAPKPGTDPKPDSNPDLGDLPDLPEVDPKAGETPPKTSPPTGTDTAEKPETTEKPVTPPTE